MSAETHIVALLTSAFGGLHRLDLNDHAHEMLVSSSNTEIPERFIREWLLLVHV